MTPAERKANERARKTGAGLSRLELWASASLHATIKAYAARQQAALNRRKAKEKA